MRNSKKIILGIVFLVFMFSLSFLTNEKDVTSGTLKSYSANNFSNVNLTYIDATDFTEHENSIKMGTSSEATVVSYSGGTLIENALAGNRGDNFCISTVNGAQIAAGDSLPSSSYLKLKYNTIGTYNGESIGAYVTFGSPTNCVNLVLYKDFWMGGDFDTNSGSGGYATVTIEFFYTSDPNTIITLDENAFLTASSLDGAPTSALYEGISFDGCNQTDAYIRESGNIIQSTIAGISTFYSASTSGYVDTQGDPTFMNCAVMFHQDSSTWNCKVATYPNRGMWFYFIDSLMLFTSPDDPVKTVNGSDEATVTSSDNIVYTVSQTINTLPDDGYGEYESLKFIDILPDEVEYVSATLTSDDSTETIDSSTGTLEYDDTTNTVTYTFSSGFLEDLSYSGQTYTLTINCKLSDTGVSTDGSFTNEATVYVNSETLTSNTVTVTHNLYKIDTSIVGGTITESISNVEEGETKTITYTPSSGYYVKTVEVDGVYINDFKTSGDTYTFSNINDDHEINVVCEKIPATVIVKYVDKNTNEEISTQTTISGYVNDDYTATAKTINGYVLSSTLDEVTGTMTSDTITVTFYYVKQSTVTAKYVDESTGTEISDPVSNTYSQGDSYTTEQKTISGYTYSKVVGTTSGTVGDSDIEVTYYYKKDSGVTAKYVDINTNEEIADPVSITGVEGDSYKTEQKEITGYVYTKVEGDTSGTLSSEGKTVTYYYTKQSDVTVKYVDYYDQDTEVATSESNTYLQGDTYTTEQKSVSGYVFYSDSGNTTGTVADKDIEVIYYYTKESNVIVKYVDYYDQDTEVATGESNTYSQGDTYTTEQKVVSGYTYYTDTNNTSGTVGSSDIEVVYYYKKNTNVISKYIDKNTDKEIEEEEEIEGVQGDSYKTEQKNISGYVYYSVDGATSGTMASDTITVTYYYIKQSGVIVKYVDYYDQDTEIATSVSNTYSQGALYSTEQKTISGYTYYTDTGNTSGTVEDENIEVVYYYKKNTSVVAYYIDKYTGETIASTVTISGKQGDSYKTEQKAVSEYEFVEVEGDTEGSMSSDTITVTYYYVKQSDVTAKYVDYYTGKEIETEESKTYSQGDTYNTEQKTISGYTFYTDTGNTSGTVEDENIEVTYYYKKNTSVIAEYVDMITGDIISSEVKITGVQGDDYTTSKKEIEGYEYIEYSGKAEGQMEADTITVTYKYKKQSDLITEHIDANSGEKIIEDVVKTYKEGDTWESYAQNFEGYVLVESPDVTTGTMEREDITKTYYYKKISAGLVVKYVDVITGDLLDQETYEGNEKDTITLDEKTFKYYVIYSRPDYTTVDLTVEAQEVIYYYIRIADIDIMGIDKDTGETLYETSKSGLEGDEYTTTPRNIEGYELVTIPDNQNGTLYRDSDPVIYEYRRVSSGVTVKYIDKDTGEELADTVTISGLYGDSYETEEKEIEDYELVEVVGDTSGTLEVEEKEVIYYYEKKTGQVIVKYEDIDGNVLDSEEMLDKVGEDYETEAKEIEGYKLVEIPDNQTGTYIDGTIEVTYVYKKLGSIIVKFVDSDGNEIADTITTEDVVGEEYYLEAPEIDGYTIVGDTYISTAYIDGELVYIIEYEKVEETVDTGDTEVILMLVVSIMSALGLYSLKNKYIKNN